MNDNITLEQHFRRAIQKLEETRVELKILKNSLCSPIAIVGMSCRFPGGANSIQLFWQKLLSGEILINDISETRWTKDKYFSKVRNAPGKMYTTKAGLIDDIDLFDAAFFGISRREAQLMDPQQRLLLEETWQAFEVAGIPVDSLKGSNTGVFIGCGSHDYINHLTQGFSKEGINAYYGTGNSSSVIAGRIAYSFGFQGPTFTLDTACSSSLVAIHEACMALRQQECSLAVAGGVNAILTPDVMINFCKANMLAEDGLCKTFDNRADGYARGEGVGILILKRLADAIKDSDTILACIIGDGVNQDGASSSLTSPNGDAQEKLIRETLNKFHIPPNTIDYVEAHGTGTSLGDPIEINALNNIFLNTHTREQPLIIGSVKTNIGHLEAAAGVAGVIKVILSLMNKKIPAHLNFKKLNPLIDPNKIPFSIPTHSMEWPIGDKPPRASVSSFGFSGTNGYIVLESLTDTQKIKNEIERDCHPFILSAKTQSSLYKRIHDLQIYLESDLEKNHANNAGFKSEDVSDICYSLTTGRVHFNHQIFFPCFDKQDLLQKLQNHKEYYSEVDTNNLLLIKLGSLAVQQACYFAHYFYHRNLIFKEHLTEVWQMLFKNRGINELWAQFVNSNANNNSKILKNEPNEYLNSNFQQEVMMQCSENYSNNHSNNEQDKKASVFITMYAILKLFKSWGIEADYVVSNDIASWAYAAFRGTISVSDAFKAVMVNKQPLNETITPDVEDSLCVISFFDCRLLKFDHDHIRDEYRLFHETNNPWLDIINALKIIHQKVNPIDWKLFESGYKRKRIILPTYPFDRKRYWQEMPEDKVNLSLSQPHPFLRNQVNTPSSKHQYVALISLSNFNFFVDHQIYDQILFPASGFIDLIYASLQQIKLNQPFFINDFKILSPLILKQGIDQSVYIAIDDHNISLYYLNGKEWSKLLNATFAWTTEVAVTNASLNIDDLEILPVPYALLQEKGIKYGPFFQSVTTLYKNSASCIAEVKLTLNSEFALLGLLDGVFQSVGAFVFSEIDTFDKAIYLPHSFKKLHLHYPLTKNVRAKLDLIEKSEVSCIVNIYIYDEIGNLLISISEYRAEKARRSRLQESKPLESKNLYYTSGWQAIHLLNACNNSRLYIYDFALDDNQLKTDLVLQENDRIVFLFTLKKDKEDLLEYYQNILLKLQIILKEIDDIPNLTKAKWVFVLRNTANLPGNNINASHSFFVGMVKSLRLENPKRSIYTLDCDDRDSLENIKQVIKHIPEQAGIDFAYHNKTLQQLTLLPLSVDQSKECLKQSYSILITGATSAICLSLVEKLLIETSATIILTSRNVLNLENKYNIERVKIFSGDITEKNFVDNIINEISQNMPPLTTIIHAAGILRDGMFLSLSRAAMQEVIRVKSLPLIYLHQACLKYDIKLQKVVALSSVAAFTGGHGQTLYAGANAFLEGYMHLLESQGLPATAIALSPVTGSKMADSSLIVKRYPKISITMEEAVYSIFYAMQINNIPHFITLNEYFVDQLKTQIYFNTMFTSNLQKTTLNRISFAESIIETLQDKSHHERISLVKEFLLKELGRVMQLNDHEFNENSGFFDLGMDSLMAIELFEIIQQKLGDGIKLNSTLLFDIPNVAALAKYLIQAIFPKKPMVQNAELKQEKHRIDNLSDEELLDEVNTILLSSQAEDIK